MSQKAWLTRSSVPSGATWAMPAMACSKMLRNRFSLLRSSRSPAFSCSWAARSCCSAARSCWFWASSCWLAALSSSPASLRLSICPSASMRSSSMRPKTRPIFHTPTSIRIEISTATLSATGSTVNVPEDRPWTKVTVRRTPMKKRAADTKAQARPRPVLRTWFSARAAAQNCRPIEQVNITYPIVASCRHEPGGKETARYGAPTCCRAKSFAIPRAGSARSQTIPGGFELP